jgi:hypothetical protein
VVKPGLLDYLPNLALQYIADKYWTCRKESHQSAEIYWRRLSPATRQALQRRKISSYDRDCYISDRLYRWWCRTR